MTRPARGFTLIELMIAVTLGLLAIAAVGSVFIYGSRGYRQDDKQSRMQDELRYAMARITTDLEMTGFFAQVRNPLPTELGGNITIDAGATLSGKDCGPTTDGAPANAANNWVFRQFAAFVFTRGNATGTQAETTFPCIDASEFQPDTDIIAIKRLGAVVGAPGGAGAFLKTNGVDTRIYRSGNPDPTTGDITIYEYTPAVWYIRRYTNNAAENPQIPCLYREILQGGMVGDPNGGCVASGIADLQLEFGLDTDATPDGIANTFVEFGAPPPIATLATVVAVRVHLLAQSAERETTYRNEKSYVLGGKVVPAANDGFYRKTLSSVVLLRNPANRLSPFALPSG